MATSVSPRPNAAWASAITLSPSDRNFWNWTRRRASAWVARLSGPAGFGSPTRAVPGGFGAAGMAIGTDGVSFFSSPAGGAAGPAGGCWVAAAATRVASGLALSSSTRQAAISSSRLAFLSAGSRFGSIRTSTPRACP